MRLQTFVGLALISGSMASVLPFPDDNSTIPLLLEPRDGHKGPECHDGLSSLCSDNSAFSLKNRGGWCGNAQKNIENRIKKNKDAKKADPKTKDLVYTAGDSVNSGECSSNQDYGGCGIFIKDVKGHGSGCEINGPDLLDKVKDIRDANCKICGWEQFEQDDGKGGKRYCQVRIDYINTCWRDAP